MDDLSPGALLTFNNRANLGNYLTSVEEIAPSLFYVYSERVGDPYCNLAYRSDLGPLTDSQVKTLEKEAAHKSRAPSIWQIGKTIPGGYAITNREVCMVADLAGLPHLDSPANVEVKIETPLPAEAMVKVFSDVFCESDNIGYLAFAKEYAGVFRTGIPNKPARTFHTGLYIDGTCVAISTVTLIDDMAGLYSVAVERGHRRKGFGKFVTYQGMKLAEREGATKIMLFTSPDTFMQMMYESIGFKSAFVVEIVTKTKKPSR